MKKLIKYFAKVFLLGYILFSFFTLSNCSKDSDNSGNNYLQIQQKIDTTKIRLINEFYVNIFDCTQINSILNQKVILDSTVVGIINKTDGKYLKAVVNNSCKSKIYALLKCNSEVLEKYEKQKSNRAYMVAGINKIENINTIVEADTLDGRTTFIRTNKSILLTADCLAIEEIPLFSNSH